MYMEKDVPLLGKRENDIDLALVMCPAWGVDYPPVGISYLKSFLREEGVRVKNFDFSLSLYKVFAEKKYWDLNYPEYFITPQLFKDNILPNLSPFIEDWAEEILSFNPKVVGFSLFMSSINASLLLAKHLKKLRPGLKIIGGGAEVTRIKRVLIDKITGFSSIDKEAILDSSFDALVDGEGEDTLLAILSSLRQGSDFKNLEGILTVNKARLIANPPRRLIDNLDMLPPTDYDDYELENYSKAVLPIVTSRGCVNRCTFCADSPLWKTYRVRSAEKVLQEINFLIKRYGKEEFEIMDSTFNGDIRRVEKICDLIINSKLNIRWSAKVTLRKEMSYELLAKMRETGCSSLAYGVESGSPNVLKDMRKNIDLTEAKRVIVDTWRAGIQANCFFIIGYPTETENDFQMTLDFIEENAKYIYSFDQITGCHIEEDSYLGLNLEKYGIVFKGDGWHSKESTPTIRKERLYKFRDLARRLHRNYECEVQM